MSEKISSPGKRRTRQHVIADQGVHFVEGFILEEGHTAQRAYFDYGYDLVMTTYDKFGYIEPDIVCFQIKASEVLKAVGGSYYHDLDMRDYRLWLNERMPVVLVLYDATRRQAFWLDVKHHFRKKESRQPKALGKFVRVSVTNIISRQAIAKLRRMKSALRRLDGM